MKTHACFNNESSNLIAYWTQRKKRGKIRGIGLFPVSERSMHFNSNPLQVDLSQSHGPEREEKVETEKAGDRGGIGGKWGMKRTIM